ncbi:putative Ig domain-containing protein [Rhizobium leguminosarum]|uniref:putative Ig domain-containing protein n=1 Tax=Rhizobium leguminosarum TaxID=384 RepID=UPI00315DBEE3
MQAQFPAQAPDKLPLPALHRRERPPSIFDGLMPHLNRPRQGRLSGSIAPIKPLKIERNTMLRKIVIAALSASFITSPVAAGQIFWRSPTSGVLAITAANTPADFGLSYGSVNVRAGTNLALTPMSRDGGNVHGFTFAASGLPAGIVVDPATGRIGGKLFIVGTVSFDVIASRNGQQQTLSVVIKVA